MIKRMDLCLKIIALLNGWIALCSLLTSSIILKQPLSFSILLIVIFSIIYSILIWVVGKKIGYILSEKQIKTSKKIRMLFALVIIMSVLQNISTLTYVFRIIKNISILIPWMFAMIVFQLADGMKKLMIDCE